MRSRVLIAVAFLVVLAGCRSQTGIKGQPVVIQLWHNYGGQMKDTMDYMIDEFNATVGLKEGIIIQVTSISGSATLHDKLLMAVNQDPGAPKLPDITTANPKTAILLARKNLLVNYETYATKQELAQYVDRFLQEGKLETGELIVFPIAKSTEVVFVNQTIFQRFANAANVSDAEFATYEGIFEMARKYYQYTDDLTPDVANDGKMFFHLDSLFHYFQLAFAQHEKLFFYNEKLLLDNPIFEYAFTLYMKEAITGSVSAYEGYASDLAKTGDIVASVGSTAGVVFFNPVVVYADNTTEPTQLNIYSYPVFGNGNKASVQRGSGMSILKSTPVKEKAAKTFLRWFTESENNMYFVENTGYLPVTKAAYEEMMNHTIYVAAKPEIQKVLEVVQSMNEEYTYYIPPVFDQYDNLGKRLEIRIRQLVEEGKQRRQNKEDLSLIVRDLLPNCNSNNLIPTKRKNIGKRK